MDTDRSHLSRSAEKPDRRLSVNDLSRTLGAITATPLWGRAAA